MDTKQFTIPEALSAEFGIRNCEYLRMTANGFVRNKLIKADVYAGAERKSVRIRDSQLPTLHNAIILHALFGDTKVVKDVFFDATKRQRQADAASALLFQRNSVMGVALVSEAAQALVDALRGDFDLRQQRLPNPFATLPHQALGNTNGLFLALLAQAGTLSAGDSVLQAYLQGDLELARDRVLAMSDLPEDLAPLRQRILEDCRQAQEFDDLLDWWG